METITEKLVAIISRHTIGEISIDETQEEIMNLFYDGDVLPLPGFLHWDKGRLYLAGKMGEEVTNEWEIWLKDTFCLNYNSEMI